MPERRASSSSEMSPSHCVLPKPAQGESTSPCRYSRRLSDPLELRDERRFAAGEVVGEHVVARSQVFTVLDHVAAVQQVMCEVRHATEGQPRCDLLED